MSGIGGVGGAGGLGGAGLWGELLGKVADKLPPGAAQQMGFDPNSTFGMGGEVNPAESKNMLMNMLAKLLGITPEQLKKMLEGLQQNGQGAPAASEGKGAGGGGG